MENVLSKIKENADSPSQALTTQTPAETIVGLMDKAGLEDTNAKTAALKIIQAEDDPNLIDLSKRYPLPEFTFKIGGIGTIPLGDIFAIKAKSKHGKSFLASIFAASALGCEDFGGSLIEGNAPNRVLYFDTEQNERNTAAIARRVHRLIGQSTSLNAYQLFEAHNMREMKIEERLLYIQSILIKCFCDHRPRPTIIIIDGIADLIVDFNDIPSSQQLIQDMMSLSSTFNIAIGCILHTNKAKADNNMKGHLGTFLVQKASDVFEVVKKDETFYVEETECRNRPISDFAFEIEDDGKGVVFPVLASGSKEKDNGNASDCIRCMPYIFTEDADNGLLHSQIQNCFEAQGVNKNTSKKRINWARDNGMIMWRDGKYFRGQKWYDYFPNSDQNQMPF